MTLDGLDKGKIANAQTHEPGGRHVKCQQWGEGPYPVFVSPDWHSDATGRIFDLWSKDVNASLPSATNENWWRTSYDDGAGGWTDTGLGYPEPCTWNPHSYSEYVEYSAAATDIWKAELTGPGQAMQFQQTQFGDEPTEDRILLMGMNAWAPTDANGLVATFRVVYDEPIDPLTIHWGGPNLVLGDFTIPGPPVGSFNGDYDVDDIDIDLLCDAIRNGSTNFELFDISADGLTQGADGFIDTLDLDYLVRSLVETAVGTGTEYGDFNLDGVIDTTDLARLALNYGADDWGWDDGNANRHLDTDIDTTDLAVLAMYYGFGETDVVPEPMTLSLLLAGASGLLARRRR